MLNDLIRKFTGKGASKEIAKKRLKFALIYDQFNVNEDIMAELQEDIIKVISRYFEIDRSSLKLDINKSNDFSALVLNTPIISAKRRKRTA